MSFLCDLYFFQGQKYTSFGKNILLRQSTSLGHSSTGHPGWMTSPDEKRNPLHQASPPHCLAADNILYETKIIPSGCSQGSLNTEYHCYKTVKVLKKPVPMLRQHIRLDRKKFHAPALSRRYSLCCCCRWYRQKLTVATFSRCLWRLEKILVDRHQIRVHPVTGHTQHQ